MTVTKIYTPTRTVGNGVTDAFTADFQITDTSDLDVYLIDTGATTNKALQTITTHYTVVINEATENATVTFITPPPSTKDVILERTLDYTQVTDIPDVATLRENQLEDPLDRNTMLIQQLSEVISRKFGASVADDTNLTTDYDLPTPVNNRALFWSLSGSVASIVNSSTDLSDIDAAVLATAADVVSTNADAVSTAADAVSTAADAVSTAADAAAAAVSAASATHVAVSNDVKWDCLSSTVATVRSGAQFRGTLTGTKFEFASDKTFTITGTAGTIGALDQGAEASSTFYYLIALGDTTAVTATDVIGVSAANYASWTVANLTGNYSVFDDFKRIGVVYNNGSSNLEKGWYLDGWFYFWDSTAYQLVKSSATFEDVVFSTVLPPVAREALIDWYDSASSAKLYRYKGTTPFTGYALGESSTGGAGQFRVLLDSSQTFETKTASGNTYFTPVAYKDDLQTEK